jgi:hypothetical protein
MPMKIDELSSEETKQSAKLVDVFITAAEAAGYSHEICMIATGRLWWYYANAEEKASMRSVIGRIED